MHVWQTEPSLKQWIIAYVISAIAAILLPIDPGERAMIVGGGLFVLAFECLNTAIERAIDYISLERHPLAKQAKDTASAAVALTSLAIGVVWLMAFIGLYARG